MLLRKPGGIAVLGFDGRDALVVGDVLEMVFRVQEQLQKLVDHNHDVAVEAAFESAIKSIIFLLYSPTNNPCSIPQCLL
jgi:hypothetical protein